MPLMKAFPALNQELLLRNSFVISTGSLYEMLLVSLMMGRITSLRSEFIYVSRELENRFVRMTLQK